MGRRELPEVNAGSMADIAFILLIFFLVSTTLASEKGVKTRLPKWDPNPPPSQEVNERNVLAVDVLEDGSLSVEENYMDFKDLKAEVITHMMNNGASDAYSDTYDEGVINLRTHPDAPYAGYVEAYSNVKAAFDEMRNKYAQDNYGKAYDEFLDNDEEKAWAEDVREKRGLNISEAVIKED